jgi:hypothetical protein
MSELFFRTLSQGLQAFIPIAAGLVWARRTGRADALAAIRWGSVVAFALTPAAGYLFQHSVLQARWEALLASVAAALAVYFGLSVRQSLRTPSDAPSRMGIAWSAALACATVVIVTRQTMEIAVVAGAAFEMRSLEALVSVAGSVILALVIAYACVWAGRRSPPPAFAAATRAFIGVFFVQALIYAFHESAEAGLLPWSEMLHAGSEPYGPDGVYGQYVSYLLLAVPIVAGVVMAAPSRRDQRPSKWSGWLLARPLPTLAVVTLLSVACVILLRTQGSARSVSPDNAATPAATGAAVPTAGASVLYRHTAGSADASTLTIAALEPPGARPVTVPFACDRVSFAAGQGICLQTDRGLFTSYKAVLFDAAMKPRHSIKLAGSPSRARVSADGRLGAVTVFLTGQAHGYSSSSFSTKTSLIDMASGEELTDLEQFTTWKDGVKIHAADFNFWGVTFAKDSNMFYATLKTNGKTYLVQGDLGLRKLTILHENVECPSLSPNNRLIAYKKRTGPDLAPWSIYVLDLSTMTERAIAAETRSVDDQLEWLDEAHVLYGMRRSSQSALSDVWVAPIDGSGKARVFIAEGDSPTVVR